MKRLLLSQGRTGSYNLTKYVNDSNLNTIVFREPFNTTAKKDKDIFYTLENILSNPNIFVENKIGKGSLPFELQNLSIDELIKFFLLKFDKIGLLTRKDIKAQTESILNAKESNNWMSPYLYKNINIEKYPEFKTILNQEKNQLEYLAKEYSLPLFYYEDLYLENQKENLQTFCNFFNINFNQEIMDKHMNIKNKYRIDKFKNII